MKIETLGLTAAPGGQEILHGIDLAARSGQFVGIIGPNGSGKSTLLKCIYRALRPSGGAVLLDGRELERHTVRQSAQKMAVVAQHNTCAFDFTVEEMVLMGRAPYKRALSRDTDGDRRIAADALAAVGLCGMEQRSVSTLSGGERQRVVLARALAQQTPCLILDEPTNHLDIQYQLGMLDLVRGLGRTVLAALHDLNMAAAYCDWLYALKEGRLVGSGCPRDLLTPEFIRSVYQVDARVAEVEGQLAVLYRPAGAAGQKAAEGLV